MKIGVHVNISKGLPNAVLEAKALGCEAFQIFSRNPRGWQAKPLNEADIAAFKKNVKETGSPPVLIHTTYLINLSAVEEEQLQKSVFDLQREMDRAHALGVPYVNTHVGKALGGERKASLKKVAASINQCHIPDKVTLLLENTAGQGSELGTSIEELSEILEQVKVSKKVGICFDTCHGFAAGYDLRKPEGWEEVLSKIEKHLGFEKLKFFHLNDSKGELNGHLDRHEHIGQGKLGLEAFRIMMNHPKLKGIPGVLETPKDTPEDDPRNLAILRGLRR